MERGDTDGDDVGNKTSLGDGGMNNSGCFDLGVGDIETDVETIGLINSEDVGEGCRCAASLLKKVDGEGE